jgi:hypothetical protein
MVSSSLNLRNERNWESGLDIITTPRGAAKCVLHPGSTANLEITPSAEFVNPRGVAHIVSGSIGETPNERKTSNLKHQISNIKYEASNLENLISLPFESVPTKSGPRAENREWGETEVF